MNKPNSLQCTYAGILNYMKCFTFSVRSRHLDQLFLINVYSPSIFCLALLETAGLREPNRNLRGSNLFSFDFPQGALRQLIPSVGKLVDSMGSLLCFAILNIIIWITVSYFYVSLCFTILCTYVCGWLFHVFSPCSYAVPEIGLLAVLSAHL
jgi:hypothetical protein